jgi:hypothetical protein
MKRDLLGYALLPLIAVIFLGALLVAVILVGLHRAREGHEEQLRRVGYMREPGPR